MNGAEKKKATPADKAVNAIIVLIILVFVAVGVYATYGKISEGVTNKEIESGKAEATVEYLANQAGQSVEDYLAQYGLTLGDTIKAKTTESEMLDNMTIENYAKYNGQEADSFSARNERFSNKRYCMERLNGNACISSYRRRRSCTG